MKNKNNSFNNTFIVTGHHETSGMNKIFEQFQVPSPFAAHSMNIAPDFSMFLQHDRQLDNMIFARHIDQEAIVYKNKCLETTLLKETSRTSQSLSKSIQASMMTSKRNWASSA